MRKSFLIIILSILIKFAYAQTAIFQVQSKIYQLPDTIVKGSTHIFGAYIKNLGDSFTGNFQYHLSIYNWQNGCYCTTKDETIPLVNFSQGDSVFIKFTETFNITGNTGYRMGGNIVVIWPRNSMNYSVTNDEAYHQFTLVNQNNSNLLSVKDKEVLTEDEIEQKTVFPNPFENKIAIEPSYLTSKIEKISIKNIQGQIVKEVDISNSDQTINLSTIDLGKGIYFLNILQKNNEIKVIRIIKYKD
jgi:DNA-binding transcriptional regulator of glucitol operon